MHPYVPINAQPCGGGLPTTINPFDKFRRKVGMSVKENREFISICRLGSLQIIDCYCEYNREFTRFDVFNLCSACPYAYNRATYNDKLIPNTNPRFIELLVETTDGTDIDEDNPKYFVYFISDGEFVKIGVAENVAKRLSGLQTSNPKPLQVICAVPMKDELSARRLEKLLHNEYRAFHVLGEWFDIYKYIDLELFSTWFDWRETNE